jgi:hypothetical protein
MAGDRPGLDLLHAKYHYEKLQRGSSRTLEVREDGSGLGRSLAMKKDTN